MTCQVTTDRALYVPWFEELDRQLAIRNQTRGFKTATGQVRRDVVADEFMYMCHDENPLKIHFKHHDTRNYVYLTFRSSGNSAKKVALNSTGPWPC